MCGIFAWKDAFMSLVLKGSARAVVVEIVDGHPIILVITIRQIIKCFRGNLVCYYHKHVFGRVSKAVLDVFCVALQELFLLSKQLSS